MVLVALLSARAASAQDYTVVAISHLDNKVSEIEPRSGRTLRTFVLPGEWFGELHEGAMMPDGRSMFVSVPYNKLMIPGSHVAWDVHYASTDEDVTEVAVIDGRVIGAGAAPRAAGTTPPPPDITVVWKKVRGPGAVTVTPSSVPLVTRGDPKVVAEATASATFSAPGEYVLRAEPIEVDDGFDDLCCFTFAHVRVLVR
jgi:hypothetical protein